MKKVKKILAQMETPDSDNLLLHMCIELFTARYDHDIKTVANKITATLAGDAKTRSIIEDYYELHSRRRLLP